MRRILVTGATGQLGSELTMVLRQKHGNQQVIATGRKRPPDDELAHSGPFYYLDVLQPDDVARLVEEEKIDTIFHLAGILSARGEANPELAWQVNIEGLRNMLEVCRQQHCSLFFPSSIAVFGPSTPKDLTPQFTVQRPNTIYGITKLAGELLCDYYWQRYGVDCRSLRYPGLISAGTRPGGGTTDYAVDIFYGAVQQGSYQCYLRADCQLDMMYMDDACQAAVQLMAAKATALTVRNGYNVTALSLSPAQLGQAIAKQIPDFTMSYQVDPIRQAIADSWPDQMDDHAARQEWNWQPHYDLNRLVRTMLSKIKESMES